MNATMEGVNARGYLSGWLQALVGMYSADINALPDDKWDSTYGGCTRSAHEITADALSLMGWTTEALNGNVIEVSGEGDFLAELKVKTASKAAAIATLQETANALGAAINAASDEAMNSTVKAPFGMEMPLFMICQVAVNHLWYHDGQLNYIQCLLGDEKIHWMGG